MHRPSLWLMKKTGSKLYIMIRVLVGTLVQNTRYKCIEINTVIVQSKVFMITLQEKKILYYIHFYDKYSNDLILYSNYASVYIGLTPVILLL